MRPAVVTPSNGNDSDVLARSAMLGMSAAARASMVNRTHRVVRERARAMQANRTAMRGLLLPMLLCSALMITLLSALWMLLDQYDLVSSEMPESIHHFFLLLLWFLPVSAGLVAMAWLRRSRNPADTEAAQ
jgi:hypothetical protein